MDKITKNNGNKVKKGDILLEKPMLLKVPFDGILKIEKVDEYRNCLKIIHETDVIEEEKISRGRVILVQDGDTVEKGDQLTEGSINLKELYKLKDKLSVQDYIMREIQYVYSSQGQPLNDKHIEIIIRQMFSKIMILDPGDTTLLDGEVIDQLSFYDENKSVIGAGKVPAYGEPVLLGITKASLSTQSFLSAASFQETTRVLIDAAVSGKVDHLRGLKENVIIGRLVPCGTGFRE